jgi:tetratricopeptide (TPR) repeat protein
MGLYEKAAPLLEEALRIRSHAFGASSLEAAASMEGLGNLQRERARYAEAGASLRESLRIRERLLRADDPALAASLHGLGVVERYAGHYAEAEAVYRDDLDMFFQLAILIPLFDLNKVLCRSETYPKNEIEGQFIHRSPTPSVPVPGSSSLAQTHLSPISDPKAYVPSHPLRCRVL